MQKRVICAICWLCVLGSPSFAQAAGTGEAAAVSIDDVWLYLPMDGSARAAVGDHVLEARYRQWTTNGITDDPAPALTFSAGLARQALDVSGPSGARPGDALAYLLDLRTFPTEAGTFALWYKPTRALAQENVWLYGMGWVRFQAQISGMRLGVHATAENRHAIYSSLKPFEADWVGRWHLAVTTWERSTVRVFMDGQMIGERTDVDPLVLPSPVLNLGSLPPGGARKTPVAYAHGLLDDVLILSKPLIPDRVQALFETGRGGEFAGFLGTLPTGALVSMRRHAYLRGEKAEATVTPFAAGGEGRLVARDGTRRIELGGFAGRGKSTLTIDTAQLRPGTYTLTAELPDPAGRVVVSGRRPLFIRARRQPDFPVGLGGELGSSEETLALYEKLHISHVSCNGPQGDARFFKQLDRCFSHGLCLFPNFNILGVWARQYESLKREPYFRKDETGRWRVNPEWGWKYLQTLVFADGSPDEHRSTSSASPFSPIAWEMMTNRIGQIMRRASDHPGLWAVSFQDEVPFRMNTDKESGKLKVGDYSHYAIEHFKKATGLDALAFPPDDAEGTVWLDDHPYLQWIQHIGLPGNDFTTVGFEDLYYRLAQEVKRYRPDVLAGNYSGGEYGKNDFVLDWNYPVIWAPEPWSWGRGSGYLDYVFDRHWARQDARPRKPLWALLGWWSDDMSAQPDWCVADFRLNTAWALAKGCKQLMWFAVSHGPFRGAKSGPFSHPGLRAELERWALFLHEKGAVFARIEKRPGKRVAVLWSKTNRAGHVLKTTDKAEYYLVFAGLRNIGVCPDVVTDRMIREGVLDDFEALVLCGFDYMSETLWRRIRAFADTPGKAVFVDESSAVVPMGAVSLQAHWRWDGGLSRDRHGENVKGAREDADAPHPVLVRSAAVGKWANHLRPIVLPCLSPGRLVVDDPSGQVGPHLLWAGDTPYLFILNTDMLEPRFATITFHHAGPVAYELVGNAVKDLESVDGRVSLAVELEPGGMAVYALPERSIQAMALSVQFDQDTLHMTATLCDAAGAPVPAAMPIRVDVLDPSGEGVYGVFSSTDASGMWQGSYRIGRLTDPPGQWRVRVTELLTDSEATAEIAVPDLHDLTGNRNSYSSAPTNASSESDLPNRL